MSPHWLKEEKCGKPILGCTKIENIYLNLYMTFFFFFFLELLTSFLLFQISTNAYNYITKPLINQLYMNLWIFHIIGSMSSHYKSLNEIIKTCKYLSEYHNLFYNI